MAQRILTAAQELRHGNANFTASTKSTGDMVKALSAPMLFDYMAIVMDKQALADRDFTMNVILPDVGEQHMLRVKNVCCWSMRIHCLMMRTCLLPARRMRCLRS